MGCKNCNKGIVDKVNNITEGWKNLLLQNEEGQELYNARIIHCNECIERKVIGFVEALTFGKIVQYKCKKCGCPLEPKLRATNETCNLGKW